jgi:hypothetical protein
MDGFAVFRYPPEYHNIYSLPSEEAFNSCNYYEATELDPGTTGSYYVSIHWNCFDRDVHKDARILICAQLSTSRVNDQMIHDIKVLHWWSIRSADY